MDNNTYPREYSISSDVHRELKEDEVAFAFYIKEIPDRFIAEHGLKRAPGSEWIFTWTEYTQGDIIHWENFHFAMDLKAPFEVGDLHYTASAMVVPREEIASAELFRKLAPRARSRYDKDPDLGADKCLQLYVVEHGKQAHGSLHLSMKSRRVWMLMLLM